MKILLFNTNPATRFVLSQLEKGEKTLVLTDQENIRKLMEVLNYDHVILHYLRSDYFFDLLQLYKARNTVKRLFEENEIDELVYYHQAFGSFFNWIITYAHRKNVRIVYQRVIRQLEAPPYKGLKAWKCKLANKILYSTDVNPIDTGAHRPIPSLSRNFIQKNAIVEEKGIINSHAISEVGRKLFATINISVTDKTVLLLTGSIISTGQVEEMEYKEKIKMLIESIGPSNIVCKCHPRFTDEVELEKSLPHIPSYIPMELLTSFFSIYIGFGSSVLIDAARNGKLAIALTDYFQSVNPNRRVALHEYFVGDSVKFVKNIQELSFSIKDYVAKN